MVNLLDRVSVGHASPLVDGAVLSWNSNFQGHKAPALATTLGEPFKAIALKAEGILLSRPKLNHLRF